MLPLSDRMLPLSDRILLKLGNEPSTARQLVSALEADDADVHHVLRGLAAQGAVEEWDAPEQGSRWRLAPAVRVTYRPSKVEVTGARPRAPVPRSPNPCRAVMTRGRSCRLRAVAEGLCFLHAPRAPS